MRSKACRTSCTSMTSTGVLPFSIEIKPGSSIADQAIFAVKKAVVSGQLAVGTPFPSVRRLSQELGINPNTAQRIIASATKSPRLQCLSWFRFL